VIGELGEGILSFCVGEYSITIGILVDVCDFPYLILVLFLVLKYNGVFLCLFPFYLIGVLRVVGVVVASLSVDFGDTLGDSSLFSVPSFPFPSSFMSFLSYYCCRSYPFYQFPP